MGGFLGIVGVPLALFLLSFSFAALSALAGLISGLLTLLVVPLLLVREVGVTALPLYCRELVGVLLVVSVTVLASRSPMFTLTISYLLPSQSASLSGM